MMDSKYNIIRTMVEKLILPQYPSLKIFKIDSYNLTQNVEYDVYLTTPKKLEKEDQMKIDTEIKNFFKMAGLDVVEQNKHKKNNILVWFKTPREKSWAFHASPGYNHS